MAHKLLTDIVKLDIQKESTYYTSDLLIRQGLLINCPNISHKISKTQITEMTSHYKNIRKILEILFKNIFKLLIHEKSEQEEDCFITNK